MVCERCGTPCPQLIEGQLTALCAQCFDASALDLANLSISVGLREEEADFFISYASPDVEWAKLTAEALEKRGFRVVYQHRDFLYGQNFPLQIDRALRNARRIIAILSPHYMRSDYAWAEWSAAWAANPDNESRRIIPIRVAPCKVDGLMAAIHYLDLVGKPKAHWGDLIVEAVAPGWRKFWKSSTIDAKPGSPTTREVDYFISYAPDDFQVASNVSQILEREGYSTRMWSPDIPRGTGLTVEAEAGLANARQLLAILSPRYLESGAVWDEWSFAREAGKLLSAIKVAPCDASHLPGGAFADPADLAEKSGDAFAAALLEHVSPLWLPGSPLGRKADYYISYARADQHWAEFVVESLRKEGYTARLWNPGRRRGPLTLRKIREAMEDSSGLIGIFSQEYLHSDYAVDEWQEAAELGLPRTAARVSRCEPGLLLDTAAAVDLVAQTDAYAQNLLDTLAPLWKARPESGAATASSRPAYFVSYAEPDAKWAEFVASTLEAEGYAVRMWNPARKRGPSTHRRVTQAIRGAGRVIAILSPAYLGTDHARDEWATAAVFANAQRPLAVRVSECDPTSLLGRDIDLDLTGMTDEECAEALLDQVVPNWLARWRWAIRRLRGVGEAIEEPAPARGMPTSYGPWGIIAPLVAAMAISFGLMSGGGGSFSLQRELRAQWNAPSTSDWTSPLRSGALQVDGGIARLAGAVLYKQSANTPNGRADFEVSFRKGVTLLARASNRLDRYYSVRVDREGGEGLGVRVLRHMAGEAVAITPQVDPVAGVGRQVAFALEMDGPRFRLFVNEASFARWEDSAIPTGAVGLQANEEDGVQLHRGGVELRRNASRFASPHALVAAVVPEFKLPY